ncbi:hypothetical protein [Croceivirga sp. JEA036]|uniref:hypothetical protein n=1 Tax=Croceivirga sp. JEA036 TaxID=2721162 RepID=UPI00143C8E7F|nr:hypothetical protein [Croceivirga sp. JEA036]NJB37473.1 hypothetical protein [Croceivirga sp. JEA036]
MKSYKWLFTSIAGLTGALGLLLMVSFTKLNPCEFAYKNTGFIKDQTQLALNAPSLDLAKYHAYKALKGTYNSQPNFVECGCSPAESTFKQTKDNLRQATKSIVLEDAKLFLELALKNTELTLNNLNNFEIEQFSTYGNEVLVMNTTETNEPALLFLNNESKVDPYQQMDKVLEKTLAKFEKSLKEVTEVVSCTEAKNFINGTLERTKKEMANPNLTEAKRFYHQQVIRIATNTLTEMGNCQD